MFLQEDEGCAILLRADRKATTRRAEYPTPEGVMASSAIRDSIIAREEDECVVRGVSSGVSSDVYGTNHCRSIFGFFFNCQENLVCIFNRKD
jgi:hypothetical protein